MKRYWRLIAIVSVVVLTIGTFYIQSAMAANNLPDITIETVNGDEDELDSVVINGTYTVGNGMGEFVELNSDGSTYDSEQSFIEGLQTRPFNERTNQLQEDYRGFMRGKGRNTASYLETEDTLAYTEVINQSVSGPSSDMEFDISVLDKESGETLSFTVPVPNRAMYAQVLVEDVQIMDGALKVFTRNYSKDGGGEKHLYSFDIANQEINGNESLMSTESQDQNTSIHISIVSNSDITAANQFIIFEKTKRPITRGPENNQGIDSEQPADEGTQEFIVYNLETGEQKTLDLPETLSGKRVTDREHSTLYFEGEGNIIHYNVETEQVTDETELPVNGTAEFTRIANGKVYMLTGPENQNNFQRLMILDLQSGDTLYEGEIKPEEPVENGALLDFNGLHIE
ncbi:hypothetical protein [Lentibacillus sp. CBA3610]|uniref:hypothetical protein n=1 Tax=Lentibacillus sp. CBA3610 TaxID=2518176 RepID=UPI0015955728|nr:hypothetical protein [Lentibacillus sp. CBA3610]QKY71099.1 hypothetical protein Len3610_17380 [Lentibacillus sp. CBA3610]